MAETAYGADGRRPLVVAALQVARVLAGAPARSEDSTAAVRERLRRVYEAEIGRLTALARTLTGDAAAGEDLAHDVFVAVARKLSENPEYLRDPAWPWLRKALVMAALQRRRTLARDLARLVRVYECPPEPRLPEGQMDYQNALATLPPRMRACVALFYGEDLSTAEVAATLGCSARTVENQLRTARIRLAPLLAAGDERGAGARAEARP